jgi:hypothetical protein
MQCFVSAFAATLAYAHWRSPVHSMLRHEWYMAGCACRAPYHAKHKLCQHCTCCVLASSMRACFTHVICPPACISMGHQTHRLAAHACCVGASACSRSVACGYSGVPMGHAFCNRSVPRNCCGHVSACSMLWQEAAAPSTHRISCSETRCM